MNVRCNRRDELADLLDVMEVEEVLKDGDYSIQVRAYVQSESVSIVIVELLLAYQHIHIDVTTLLTITRGINFKSTVA